MTDTIQIVVDGLGSVTQARVRRWLKKVGEPVLAFEPLVELDTDHATIELRARSVGRLTAVMAGAGEVVSAGAAIGVIAPGTSDTKWTVYREPGWRDDFPLLSQIATWLGLKR
jgi:2-oxoglutarate dehydrogenase E2 component (dihydrolipoamide succinyltransferase)